MGETQSGRGVSRRGMITGAGAALAAVGLARVPRAEAVPAVPASGEGVAVAKPDGSPLSTPIASAPISGYVYRYVGMYEFRPFNPAAQLSWGGSGTYTSGTGTTMRASVDVPPGSILRDVEWYVYNTSAGSAVTDVYLTAAGSGTITSVGATEFIAPTGGSINAARVVVPAASAGPFPPSSKLMVSIATPADGSVQCNGVRLGFTQGDAATGLLPTPTRIYDSRSGSKPGRASTRTITFPASLVPPGVSGVIVNIVAIDAAGQGFLTAYAANIAKPGTSTLNYVKAAPVANQVTVGISSGRQIKIYTSQAAHYLVDLFGVIA